MIEHAAGVRLVHRRGVFAGLADQLGPGWSQRDCEVAAASGRLAELVRMAERRSLGRQRGAGLPGALALARIRAREVEAKL